MNVSYFVLNLFNALAMVYAASKIIDFKINYKSKKLYLIISILTLCGIIMNLLTQSILKSIILFQIYNVCYIYLFRNKENNIPKITLVSLFCWIMLLFSEVIVALSTYLFFMIFSSVDKLNYFSDLLGYVVVIVFIIVMSIKEFDRFLYKIIKATSNFKIYNIIFCTMSIFVMFTTILYLIYFDLSQPLKFLLMILIFIEYMYLVVAIIIGIKNKEKVQKDLDLMIEVTSKYEGVITDIRMKNHENRNQLIVIKDIINQNSEKAISYIDAMLQNKYNDDEELILKVANIPVGGLKGLIYYKLLTMKSNGIDGHLEISKRVNKNVLSGLDEKVTQSFYKIIGVFLDNAIDAVKKLDKKIILIELFMENDSLVFSISNEYNEKIDFENLGKFRISTKGEGNGYGLQLVRELVEAYDDLFNQTEVIGNLFVQKVGIKINKKQKTH